MYEKPRRTTCILSLLFVLLLILALDAYLVQIVVLRHIITSERRQAYDPTAEKGMLKMTSIPYIKV